MAEQPRMGTRPIPVATRFTIRVVSRTFDRILMDGGSRGITALIHHQGTTCFVAIRLR